VNRVSLIGLGGPSGSGKSTVTRLLVEKLGDIAILHQDWFFYDDPDVDAKANFCDAKYLDTAAFARAAQQLSAGEAAIVPNLDERTFRVTGSRIIQPKGWVIIEGMTVLRQPSLLELMQHAFYLAPSEQVVIARKRFRDQMVRRRTAEVIDAQLVWVLAEYRSDLRSLPPGVMLLNADLPRETLVEIILSECLTNR
jgi:uridine kinase